MIIKNDMVVKMANSEIKHFVSVCTVRTEFCLPCRGCIFYNNCEKIHAFMIRKGLHFVDYE